MRHPARAFLTATIALLITASAATANGSDTPGSSLEQRLDGILEQATRSYGIPGLCLGVVKDGEAVYSRAIGVKSLSTGEPLTPRSLFHMASVTKPFVATAVMQLVEQGKIQLDDPVVRHVPYFKVADEASRKITIRQMLRHISGMPDVQDYEWDRPVFDDGALERYVRGLEKERLIAPPGTRHQYSNMAFEVLGDVIAKASGKSFEDYVAENILDPLGMKDSTLLKKKANPELLTTGHVTGADSEAVVSAIYPYNRMHAPSSTLISNLPDLARWALLNLNRGELTGVRILPESAYDQLFEPDDGRFTNIGLSWFLGSHRGLRTVGHGGADTGYRSQLTLVPEKSLAVFGMSNFSGTPMSTIARAALDVALGHEPDPLYKPLQRVLLQIIETRGVDSAVARYKRLKRVATRTYDFREHTLIGLGGILQDQERTDDARRILELNLESYPDSWASHEALGDLCASCGDSAGAIASYRKALSLHPEAKRVREKLADRTNDG